MSREDVRAVAAAAEGASGASDNAFFHAINRPLATVLGEGVDAAVHARAADPVKFLAVWLGNTSGADVAGASAADVAQLRADNDRLRAENERLLTPRAESDALAPTMCTW